MRNVEIDLSGFDLAEERVQKAVKKGIRTSALLIEGYAKQNAPVDTGALQNSIYADFADGGKRDSAVAAAQSIEPDIEIALVEFEPVGDLDAKVAVAVNYGTYVEMGTKSEDGAEINAPQPYLMPASDVVDVNANIAKEVKAALN